MKNERKLILIAGGTASGKSMVADNIKKQFEEGGKEVSILTMDNYYKTLEQLGTTEHSEVNWDSPKTFDWDRLKKDIYDLLDGKDIVNHRYIYGAGAYDKEDIVVKSSDFIMLEGLFALLSEDIRKLADVQIFVNVDEDIRLIRRVKRDSEGRYANNFDSMDFMNQWLKVIKPMHNKYIQPTKEHADLIINNNKEKLGEEKTSLSVLLHAIMVK